MKTSTDTRYPPIGSYALIGDCHSAALVGRDGSIDWFCPGRFDAPAVFCRLLDVDKGGFLRTAPTAPFSVERQYRASTNVLETTFTCAGGRLRSADFMPIEADRTRQYLLRRLECLDGQVELEVQFKPTFNYARGRTDIEPWIEGGVLAQHGAQVLTLVCPGVRFETARSGLVHGTISLSTGDHVWLVLAYAERGPVDALETDRCQDYLERTVSYWEHWAGQCTYRGPYRDMVLRSALALKLLTYEPTGAVVAAPTTALPEDPGGARNWDYRYTWLRDASLILYALLTVGYGQEASDFMNWVERTVGSDPTREPQIMYGIDGRHQLPEQILDHLDGYRGSRPVRIGNAAAMQRQLDIYGEVVRAAGLHYQSGGHPTGDKKIKHPEPTDQAWAVLRGLVNRAAESWRESGNGIWEVRGGPQQFLYGKLMCWAALDSGLRLAQQYGLPAPTTQWAQIRTDIRQAILERGYNAQIGAFTQAFGSSVLDASALVIPRVGFLSHMDPRVTATVEEIRRNLTRDGLVYRYRTHDGLAGGEGTFTLCSFWLVDALALGGRVEEARTLFERVLGYANDVGLLAEEINPDTGEQLGNFPQGFSQMALIGAAVNLAKGTRHGPEDQPQREGERARHAGRAASTAAGSSHPD